MEEEWKNLSGCNSCINSSICKDLGNCLLLTVDMHFPENNKRKRNLITRLRQMPHISRSDKVEQIVWDIIDSYKPKMDLKFGTSKSKKADDIDSTYRTWNG